MDKKLIEKAKKHNVQLTEVTSVSLPARQWENNSAKKWVETIQEFLTKHNLDDADIMIDIIGHDAELEDIIISGIVDRTEEDVENEIVAKIDLDKRMKEAVKNKAKKKQEEEKALYQKLKMKYDVKP